VTVFNNVPAGFNPVRLKNLCFARQFALTHQFPAEVQQEEGPGDFARIRNGQYYEFVTTIQGIRGRSNQGEPPICFKRMQRRIWPDRWMKRAGVMNWKEALENDAYDSIPHRDDYEN